jgi:hypothetical protein
MRVPGVKEGEMELRHDPFPLIFARGGAATKLVTLQLFGLGDSPQGRGCLLELIRQQRADGAFPSGLDPTCWGMRETVRNAHILLKAGLPPKGVNVDSAVRFILRHQDSDGGWTENRSLDILPEAVELSNERGVTWLTADSVELLRQVGMEECLECQAALEWLRTMQNQRGGWYCYAGAIGEQRGSAGDPDSTAQITFLMREVYGEDDPTYLEGNALLERFLDRCAQDAERGYWIRLRDGKKEPLDVYHLTHLLLSWLLDCPRRIQSGYDVSDPRVRRMMEALIDIQRADGGWRPFFAEESSPVYTALAVRVLILSGVLDRAVLRRRVKTYSILGNRTWG